MAPFRNVGVTIPCPVCTQPFTPVGRQRVCSAACRQATWRRRQAAPLPSIPRHISRASTIYACSTCDARYLGEQRCAECGSFCRRLGPGAPCPHCDEPVLLADLLAGLEGGDALLH